MLDPRLLRVTLDLQGVKTTFETVAINAVGTKFASAIQNACELRIANIDKDTRNRLLTDGTPFTALEPPKNSILIEAGRESSGLSQIYIGDITTVNVSQAPDIWLTIKALTGQHNKGDITSLSRNESTKFSAIASGVADALGLSLDFEGGDKNVSNFSFTGAATKLVDTLGEISFGTYAYIDDEKLVVRNRETSEAPAVIDVNIDTGLIGLPEFIDFGVRCTILMNPALNIGDDINLISQNYPAANGRYNVYKLSFNLANRDQPFYYILEASRKSLSGR